MGRPQPHVEEGTEGAATTEDRGIEKVSQSVSTGGCVASYTLPRHFMFEVLSFSLWTRRACDLFRGVHNYNDNYY